MPRFGQKNLFAGFKIGFTAVDVLFLEHWKLFCIDWRYGCKDTGDNVYSPTLKLSVLYLPFTFKNIGGYFASIGFTVAKIRVKKFFAGYELVITIISVLSLERWRLICVNYRYVCQDTGENFYSPALKWCLRHSPFYF